MQETGKEEDEIDRALLWKKARQMKKGGYDPNVQIVVDKMVSSCEHSYFIYFLLIVIAKYLCVF